MESQLPIFSDLKDRPSSNVDPKLTSALQDLMYPKPKNRRRLAWILFLSLGLFVLAELGRTNLLTIAIIVVVLIVHELGHLTGMLLFGYQDVRMFFLPFFGAAVAGRGQHVAPWKRAVVTLLGPLPGIFLSAPLVIIANLVHSPLLQHTAFLFLVINAFNLIPVLPLDGGRFWLEILFCRHVYLDSIFRYLTGIVLLMLFLHFGRFLFAFFSVILFLSAHRTYKEYVVAAKVRPQIPDLDRYSFTSIPENVVALISRESASVFKPVKSPKLMAARIQNIWNRVLQKSPGGVASFILASVYLGTCAFVLILGVLAILAAHAH